MSDSMMSTIVGVCAITLACGTFAFGYVRGGIDTREQLFFSCVAAQQTTPVAIAFHICSALTGTQ